MSVLEGLKPVKVFRFFEEIASIPHGSGDTKKISDHLVDFARKRDLEYYQDDRDNVIIWKKGTKGYEERPCVMLQGHMDMVCEKDKGVDIDFKKDGLKLVLKDGMLSAEGTTLGGDDGIAVAYMMAVLDSDDIPHPPIEAVFTTDEEIGLLGAAALDMSKIRSKRMINLDSEEEGCLLVSCAGGVRALCSLPVERKPFSGVMLTVSVDGLLGGHSGQEIDKGRANSNMILGRVLSNLLRTEEFRLVTICGGNKDNVIPKHSEAVIVTKDEVSFEVYRKRIKELNEVIRAEYYLTDPDIVISIKASDHNEDVFPMDDHSTKVVVSMLRLFPQGVQRMSAEIPGMVQTSLNLGVLKDEGEKIFAEFGVRSSVTSEKEEVCERLITLMEGLEGGVEFKGDYPAWKYCADSPLRELMVKTYKEMFKKDMEVCSIHAGLECGFFSDNIEGLDAVSIGPEMKDIHTSSERLDVSSVERTWDYILTVLKNMQ